MNDSSYFHSSLLSQLPSPG